MGQPLLNQKPAQGPRSPFHLATPRRKPHKGAPRPRKPAPSPGQLFLDLYESGDQEHTPGVSCWCGQEATTFGADGLGWCTAHTPQDLFI